jgi:hypothetical protein
MRDGEPAVIAKREHPRTNGRGRQLRSLGLGGIKARTEAYRVTGAKHWFNLV